MPKKYHIDTEICPPKFNTIGKYSTIEFREDCAGSCRKCVKKKCVYGVFEENHNHEISMNEPEFIYHCMSCFRCMQECTKGIFTRILNPDYRTLGDGYFTGDIINRTWYQAHTGKIPVSGAGYRGPFVGPGFDSMWTDMSEIVRPTRDGIHGREYINTSIDLARKLTRLHFNEERQMTDTLPPILESPMPLIFKEPPFGMSENVRFIIAKSAFDMGAFMFIEPGNITKELAPLVENLIPTLPYDYSKYKGLIKKCRMIELTDRPGIEKDFAVLREDQPGLIIAVRIPLNAKAAERAAELAKTDVDTLHFNADRFGNERDTENPRFLKEMIREVHLKLIDGLTRQKVNLIFSGGTAMAEHMAKALICGADGITVDISLLIALECRVCGRCSDGLSCPVKMEECEIDWGIRRITNLISAWRNQLLEVMGAMGIREARRLRGEVGRSMWFEDLEKENFGPIFGERKISGLG